MFRQMFTSMTQPRSLNFRSRLGGQALGYTSFRELHVETLVTHVGIGSQGPLLSHAVSTKVFSSTMNYTRVGLINV